MFPYFTHEHCSSSTQKHARELNTHSREYTGQKRKVTSELYLAFNLKDPENFNIKLKASPLCIILFNVHL